MGTAQSSKAVSAIDQVSQSPVVIYSKTDCSFCDKAKNLLSHEQVPYVAYELNQMVNGRQIFGEIFAQTHLRTVPQIFICGEFVGGYSELLQLYNSGRLKSAVDQCSSVGRRQ